jgi:hypothetical protein
LTTLYFILSFSSSNSSYDVNSWTIDNTIDFFGDISDFLLCITGNFFDLLTDGLLVFLIDPGGGIFDFVLDTSKIKTIHISLLFLGTLLR